MDYSAGFDSAGNPLNNNPYQNETLPTLGSFNASDFDFSNMLNFTPPIANSQTYASNIPGNLRQSRSDMPGNYVSGSEYPFPNIPTSMSQSPSAPVTTLALASLSITSYSDFPDDGLPRSVSLQDQPEPQSVTLQAQQETERQGNRVTRSVGQKRETPNSAPGEEPKPKRKRGAKKKVRSAEEQLIRRENHLKRNRDAAQKCRQKKKLTEAQKQNEMNKERQDNHMLWNTVASLQDELTSLRSFALNIESKCPSDEHKTEARTGLETIMQMTAKLEAQILLCNHRRSKIFPGLVMQRAPGGYAQQDTMQDSPGPMQDGQSPGMLPQSSSNHPENMRMARADSYAEVTADDQLRQMRGTQTNGMGGRSMSHVSPYPARQINTEFASDVNMSRQPSNDSAKLWDSAVDFNSPAGAKKGSPLVEDEAIDNSAYTKKVPFTSPESMEEGGDDDLFALF
ncbi:hypothetical protein BKA61DRAFT_566860 [Leptodontidium sp. MPI-SDFR-AT-0119]|nr:hypothetical protein BKA61DRAFT_566860 [Leptodontidium sp. MPI-SDFR-AT-0119]